MNNALDIQRGSAILAIMLILIVASSYVLISQLNASSQRLKRQITSLEALNQAKAALISYAVSYPERTVTVTSGPGVLPCPSQDDNGVAPGNCAFNTVTPLISTSIGKFPWSTLNTGPLRDEAGELIWYVVTNL